MEVFSYSSSAKNQKTTLVETLTWTQFSSKTLHHIDFVIAREFGTLE